MQGTNSVPIFFSLAYLFKFVLRASQPILTVIYYNKALSTVNREYFVSKIFHAINFHVK